MSMQKLWKKEQSCTLGLIDRLEIFKTQIEQVHELKVHQM